jgi:hypothetical protein
MLRYVAGVFMLLMFLSMIDIRLVGNHGMIASFMIGVV